VLGIGEIGLNKNSRNEIKVLELHVDLAARHDQLILVHTPHLEDKLKGTRLILEVLENDKRIRPERVIIDHVEEHTIELVLDSGMWAGMTLYPESNARRLARLDMVERYGNERLWMNTARAIGALAIRWLCLRPRWRWRSADIRSRKLNSLSFRIRRGSWAKVRNSSCLASRQANRAQSSGGPCGRQFYPEAASFAWLGIHADTPSHALDTFSHDSEADARSWVLGAVDQAGERLEKLLRMFRFDADAVVPNADPHHAIAQFAPDADLRDGFRSDKLEGIAQQIGKDLFEHYRAAAHRQ